VVVDSTDVVSKVSVNGECSLNWTTGHDGLLDFTFSAGRLSATGEGVLVAAEVTVVRTGASVTLAWALRRGLLRASRSSFGRVRIVALGTVVVAVR
jgi:hypothetical protein